MNSILKELSDIGIIPVIALDHAEQAEPLAEALIAGGIPAAEVTFRTAAGEEAIRRMTAKYPEMLVGAGTVLNPEQARRAIDAGARFIVSPGFSKELVAYCQEVNVPVLPGCHSASDLIQACNMGLEYVKFFPAEQSGGLNGIQALAPVFPSLSFMPTGGVNTKNVTDYLNYDKIFACGGTWMVKKDMINAGKFDEITAICKDAIKTMLGFSLAHVGFNTQSAEEAADVAKQLCALLGVDYRKASSSSFAGEMIECMDKPVRGTNGHIGIGTYNVDRAVYQMKKHGVVFDESTITYDDKGRMKFIYIQDEVFGFAIHLVKK